ncbi:MAG: hypothetical protein WCP21_11225, partial [Armatimonadota bacterium]
MRILLISLAATLCVGLWAAEPSVSVAVRPMSHHSSDVPPHVGHDCVNQNASLSTGAITYELQYNACWDAAHEKGVGFLEGYLGMTQPTSANWYAGGFLGLKINGTDLGETRLSDLWIAEQGQRGNLKFFWDTPQAGVTISLVALPNDDRLFVGITLSPKTEIKTLDVRLLSYPSYFTYWNKRDGDRKLLTAMQTYPQADGKPLTLNPVGESWLALYDTIFDPAKGEGDGGCAVAFVPEQLTYLGATVGSYGCPVGAGIKPDTKVIRMCFWDFNKHGNEESLAKLKASVGPTLELLRSIEFAPLALTQYEVGPKIAGAKGQLGNLPGSEALLTKLTAQGDALQTLQREVREGLSPTPAATEKKLQEALAAFEQLLW